MIAPDAFQRLVAAASRAPSADNMQAWSFALVGDAIEVSLDPARLLPTDVNAMFAWVSLGAVVENLVVAAGEEGFTAWVEDDRLCRVGADTGGSGGQEVPVIVHLRPGGAANVLAGWIEGRETNRDPYQRVALERTTLEELTRAVDGLDVGLHWVEGGRSLDLLARMDARSTYIRLEHRPLHDELFSILRFSGRELEATRFGLDFASLGVPHAFVFLARLLRHRPVMDAVSRLGVGRLLARQLAAKLRACGAVCLITARRPGPAGYVDAGRAMERLWLVATRRGLAVQPHGVLPQYLTKLAVEPDGFTAHFADVIGSHEAPFRALFPIDPSERPAIVLRVGWPRSRTGYRSLRLPVEQVIREGEVARHGEPR